ncbi:MAG: hypothetical protein SAL70_09585, partial [Scytonema sp. PMC 1070.18]|nr:hypothetical protein [Scytonema sp. PMC 1070.18]
LALLAFVGINLAPSLLNTATRCMEIILRELSVSSPTQSQMSCRYATPRTKGLTVFPNWRRIQM